MQFTAPPSLVIVGRPNVGKSTLFNRLAGKVMALTADEPGVTRDVRTVPISLGGRDFELSDTAGLDEGAPDSLPARQRKLTERAVKEADLLIFVVDARLGITGEDKAWARWLRKANRPLLLVANKCDGTILPAGFQEAEGLGFGQALPVAAEHNDGITDLVRAILHALPPAAIEENEESDEDCEEIAPNKPIAIAIIGRPNAGKSTLVNQILGEERVLTGPEAGLTRDSVSLPFSFKGQSYRLVDTAGIRRKGRQGDKLERGSMEATMRAVRLAPIVFLLVDAVTGLDKQDLILADHVAEEGRNLLLVLNKWDAVEEPSKLFNFIRDKIDNSLYQVSGLPLLTISAATGKGVSALFPPALEQYRRWQTRIPTGQLNQWLEAMVAANPPPMVGGRRIKLRYMTQAKSRPPFFVVFTNKPEDVPDSYTRYLMNGLRKAFDLQGVPLRVSFRGGSDNPYKGSN